MIEKELKIKIKEKFLRKLHNKEKAIDKPYQSKGKDLYWSVYLKEEVLKAINETLDEV